MRWLQEVTFFLLLWIVGCSREEPGSISGSTAVFGLLKLGSPIQEIRVEKIAPQEEELSSLTPAEIVVKWDAGSVNYYPHPDTDGLYLDTTAYEWLCPSSTYCLIVKSDCDTITGETTTPGYFSLVSPGDSETVRLYDSTTTTVEWNKSIGARIYYLCFTSMENDSESVFFPLQDTILNLFYYREFFESSGWYKLRIEALDENIYQWEINGRTTVLGGEGFWGSVAIDSVHIWLECNP